MYPADVMSGVGIQSESKHTHRFISVNEKSKCFCLHVYQYVIVITFRMVNYNLHQWRCTDRIIEKHVYQCIHLLKVAHILYSGECELNVLLNIDGTLDVVSNIHNTHVN